MFSVTSKPSEYLGKVCEKSRAGELLLGFH